MSNRSYSEEVAKFRILFRKLRDETHDDPTNLLAKVTGNELLKKLCLEIDFATWPFTDTEGSGRDLFVAPVDPKFVVEWRDYEKRYSGPIAEVFFADLGLLMQSSSDIRVSESELYDRRWNAADEQARERAGSVEEALDFADTNIQDDWREFPEGFAERVRDGLTEWKKLRQQTGFRLVDIFRRRSLIPFVLVPEHVSDSHGSSEKLSLFTHLRQAHDAFVFGVPFAAISLMRSILDEVLKNHYGSTGKDLEARINNAANLPNSVWRDKLHDLRLLANNILHVNSEKVRLPHDLEKEMLSYFNMLRALIEAAPDRPNP